MQAPLAALPLLLLAGPQEEPDETPRLIVTVVVDQLIPQQLERLEPYLKGGFRRFLQGQVFRRATHDHGATETAPGHATLATGVHPSRHGIVGNSWRTPDGALAYCVRDPDEVQVGADGRLEERPSVSPASLLVPGISDHLKAAVPEARCVGIAGKDRAAVLSTGRQADLVLWWDRLAGGFATSSWYAPALPPWVAEWNGGWAGRVAGRAWKDALPEGIERSGTGVDDRPGEPAGRRTFPHVAPDLQPTVEAGASVGRALVRWVFSSPFIDAFVLEMASGAVEHLGLGADAEPDFLFVGLTGCDTVGHAYGPYSREVTDLLLRTDVALGAFFDELDERVGAGRWIAALSSDHGVLPLPERLVQRGEPARRVAPARAFGFMEPLRELLQEVFGADPLVGFGGGGLRLSASRMEEAGLDPAEVRALVSEFLETELPWLERALTHEELERPTDPLARLVARSFHPERTADVVVVPKPGILLQNEGTSHGTPWSYDRAVPVAFFGRGFAPGARYDVCRTVDVLPTLFFRAGLEIPADLDGRPLD